MQICDDIESEDQQAAMSHHLPLEIYSFLSQRFVSVGGQGKPAEGEDPVTVPPSGSTKSRRGRGREGWDWLEKSKQEGNGEWPWVDQIPAIPTLTFLTLRLKTKCVWTSTSDLNAFVTYALSNISSCTPLTCS